MGQEIPIRCTVHDQNLEAGASRFIYGLFTSASTYYDVRDACFPNSNSWEPGGCDVMEGQPQTLPASFCPGCRKDELIWLLENDRHMAELLDPTLRDERLAACRHKDLHFSNGGYHLVCRYCGSTWVKCDENDKADQKAMDWNFGPEDRRTMPQRA